MRWHFPIMRAGGGTRAPPKPPPPPPPPPPRPPPADKDWHFPLQSKNVHVLVRQGAERRGSGTRRRSGHQSSCSPVRRGIAGERGGVKGDLLKGMALEAPGMRGPVNPDQKLDKSNLMPSIMQCWGRKVTRVGEKGEASFCVWEFVCVCLCVCVCVCTWWSVGVTHTTDQEGYP